MFSIYIKSKDCYKWLASRKTLEEAIKFTNELKKHSSDTFQVYDSIASTLPFDENVSF